MATGHAGAGSGNAPIAAPLADALLTPLVGRDHAMRIVDRQFDRGGLVVISGEAGIGKTRLLAELASQATSAGRAVLFGRCSPAAAYAYEPFVEALRRDEVVARLGRLPHHLRSRLATLLPELGETDASAHGLDLELQRLHLFDAVAAAMDEVGGDRPALVLLDDLHWAESSTLSLLAHLHGQERTRRALLIGTHRDPDPDLGTALAPAIAGLRRIAPIERVAIEGLDDASVARLVEQWAGQEPAGELAADLRARTGGNPFFLRSVLEQLRDDGALYDVSGHLPDRLPAGVDAPDDVVEAITHRAAALGPPAQSLLAAGAVLGREFRLDEALAVAELPTDEGVDAADAATRAGLVNQIGAGRVLLRFDHALVQQALVGALTPSRRALLHLRAGESIERTSGAAARVGELARHFGEAFAFGGAARALVYARQAADRATGQYAFDEAVAHLELGLRALDAAGGTDWEERHELLMALGLAQHRAGEPARSNATFRGAAHLAEEHGDETRIARAALGPGLERFLHRFGEPEPIQLALLERAVQGSEGALRARVASVLAHERCFLDPLERRTREIDEATALAREAEDENALLDALTVRQIVSWWPGRTIDLFAALPDVAASARALGRPDVALHLHCTAVGYAFELNRRAEMEEHLDAARGVAGNLRVPIQRLRIRALQVARLLTLGDLRAAREAIAEAIPAIAQVEPLMAAHVTATWQFVLAREDGDLTAVTGLLQTAVSAAPPPASLRAMLAETRALQGDLAGARRELDLLARDDFGAVHRDMLWLGVLTMCASTASILGDRRRAAPLYAMLRPWEGRNALLGLAAVDRPVSLALGLLARTLDQPEVALAHLDRTVNDAQEFGAAPWEARALYESGRVLRSCGRDADARDALRRSLDLCDRYGGTWLAERCRGDLRAAGARPRRDRLAGPEALTAGELRVARLAAGGLTNAQICETLVLAPRTVETHLTQAYRKLGASRVELASLLL